MNSKSLASSLILLFFCFLLFFCGQSQEQDQKKQLNQSTNSPIILELTIDKAPKLFEKVLVKSLVKCCETLHNVKIKIELPVSAFIISGDTTWQGTINKDTIITLATTIMFVKEGNWIIRSFARYDIDKSSWWGDAKEIYLYVGKEFSKFGFLDSTKEGSNVERTNKSNNK